MWSRFPDASMRALILKAIKPSVEKGLSSEANDHDQHTDP